MEDLKKSCLALSKNLFYLKIILIIKIKQNIFYYTETKTMNYNNSNSDFFVFYIDTFKIISFLKIAN